MKGMIRSLFILISSCSLICSCSSGSAKNRNITELLKSNHFDLPELRSFTSEGIRFTCSDFFEEMQNVDISLTRNGKVYWISSINVWLCTEQIDHKEITRVSIDNDSSADELMKHLVNLRKRSITYPSSSIFNHYSTSQSKIINIIVEGNDMYGSVMETYDMGLVKKGKEYYLFQLYGSEKGISYLHDDFLDILKSVR